MSQAPPAEPLGGPEDSIPPRTLLEARVVVVFCAIMVLAALTVEVVRYVG